MLTIAEYNVLMKAVELRMVDESFYLHRQAFLNHAVRAEKKVGKSKTVPVYSVFKKFFDYDKEIQNLQNKKKSSGRFEGISKILKKGEK